MDTSLAETIYHYYRDHLSELSDDKRFHFATRTAAWLGYDEMKDVLRDCKGYIAPDVPLEDTLRTIIETPQTGQRNAHAQRQPFFEKYPLLYGVHLALFRVRHLQSVYGIDAREALFANVSLETLNELETALLNDEPAVHYLSTFAVNYLYLFERIVKRNEDTLDPAYFLQIGAGYDTSDPIELQLLIYLYTHCIIGESNFYTRRIAPEKLPGFTQMLAELEPLIIKNFTNINLDNKLEFLTCARIIGYQSSIASAVYEECADSISPEGSFLIDTKNTNGQDDRRDFNKSEHRNVLFIMSSSPYEPHSTLL